jgi:hypothetical protein
MLTYSSLGSYVLPKNKPRSYTLRGFIIVYVFMTDVSGTELAVNTYVFDDRQ